jgi:hypothetical protein
MYNHSQHTVFYANIWDTLYTSKNQPQKRNIWKFYLTTVYFYNLALQTIPLVIPAIYPNWWVIRIEVVQFFCAFIVNYSFSCIRDFILSGERQWLMKNSFQVDIFQNVLFSRLFVGICDKVWAIVTSKSSCISTTLLCRMNHQKVNQNRSGASTLKALEVSFSHATLSD